jgi:hypothetical protein
MAVLGEPITRPEGASTALLGLASLLTSTEAELATIATAVRRQSRPLRGKDRTALRVGKVINHYKVAKHFVLRIEDDVFSFQGAEAQRTSPVAPALGSESALRKVRTKRTEHNEPVHSFATLLKDLATIAANKVQPLNTDLPVFTVTTTPTPIQRRAFELLGVSHRLGCA